MLQCGLSLPIYRPGSWAAEGLDQGHLALSVVEPESKPGVQPLEISAQCVWGVGNEWATGWLQSPRSCLSTKPPTHRAYISTWSQMAKQLFPQTGPAISSYHRSCPQSVIYDTCLAPFLVLMTTLGPCSMQRLLKTQIKLQHACAQSPPAAFSCT